MVKEFDFDEDFQKQAVGLMLHNENFTKLFTSSGAITAADFDLEYLGWMFAQVDYLTKKYGTVPSVEVFEREVDKSDISEANKVFIKNLIESSETFLKNESYIRDEISGFVMERNMRRAMKLCVTLMKEKNYSNMVTAVTQAYNSTGTADDSVNEISYFFDYEKRLEERLDEELSHGIPTCIPELDCHFAGGGVCKGELACCLAPPNRGKSQWLVKVGKAALIHRKKVLHISMEMNQKRVAERYDQNFLGLTKEDLFTSEGSTELRKFMETQGKYFTKNMKREGLVIKFWPPRGVTVSDIKNYIIRKRINGIKFDLVIVDYGGVIKPDVIYKNNYIELGNIFYDLANMAAELDVAVWTASQASRDSFKKKTISMGDFAESIKIVHPCHIIIALCQTPHEYKQNIMRLVIIKNREGEKEVEVKIKTSFATSTMQAIMGLPDEEEEEDDDDVDDEEDDE